MDGSNTASLDVPVRAYRPDDALAKRIARNQALRVLAQAAPLVVAVVYGLMVLALS